MALRTVVAGLKTVWVDVNGDAASWNGTDSRCVGRTLVRRTVRQDLGDLRSGFLNPGLGLGLCWLALNLLGLGLDL